MICFWLEILPAVMISFYRLYIVLGDSLKLSEDDHKNIIRIFYTCNPIRWSFSRVFVFPLLLPLFGCQDSLESFGVPSDLWTAHRDISTDVLANCVRLTQLRARTLLKSRSRQHRSIPKLIPEYNFMQTQVGGFLSVWSDVEDFPHFQGLGMDEMLEINYGKRLGFKKPMWTWVTDQAISLMQIELQLTFELGLADNEEMPMLLWFEDYLIGVRVMMEGCGWFFTMF